MRSILRWLRSLTFPQTHPSPTRRAQEMEAFEVSKDVGNVRNNSAELLNSK
jgi:hypothetical protein